MIFENEQKVQILINPPMQLIWQTGSETVFGLNHTADNT